MVADGWKMCELTGSAWGVGLVGLYPFVPALPLTRVAGLAAACLVTQVSVALIQVAAAQG